MNIIQATSEHLNHLVPLFDGYRVFYRQESNKTAVKTFLKERLTKKDSVIYLAYIDEIPVGFTQLYFLFSSVSMRPMFILNDLYIDKNYRGKSIGTSLINKAKDLCSQKQYKGIIIQTENTNPAQHLYQREGFVKDTDLTFFWTNK
ncbi:GNAT family N-acetyltransferase [Gaetbulibacter sp. 4G1]|nr:GNAT family N-acetyltransferase [Gaetbulibacter sp. 4G1]PIA82140.1 GNAT family N-acetyltransferase [Gaetbulibacter sp. 4G1]